MLTKCSKSSRTVSQKKKHFFPALVLPLFIKPFNAAVHVALIKPNWEEGGVGGQGRAGGVEGTE